MDCYALYYERNRRPLPEVECYASTLRAELSSSTASVIVFCCCCDEGFALLLVPFSLPVFSSTVAAAVAAADLLLLRFAFIENFRDLELRFITFVSHFRCDFYCKMASLCVCFGVFWSLVWFLALVWRKKRAALSNF